MSEVHKAMEVYPGLILGGLWMLYDILKMEPDVLVPLDSLPGWVNEKNFKGEVIYSYIPDYGTLPDDELDELATGIAERIRNGKKVAVFCLGGQGRTGYVASCVLHLFGVQDPVLFLRKNYNPNSVETWEQMEAVQNFCSRFKPYE